MYNPWSACILAAPLIHQEAKPKWRGVNDVYRLSGFDALACGNQPDRNCDVRTAAFRADSVTAVPSLWLNVFVLIAQLFMKVPALDPLAPTGSEPPFLIAQTVVRIVFIALAILAAKNFRGDIVQAA